MRNVPGRIRGGQQQEGEHGDGEEADARLQRSRPPEQDGRPDGRSQEHGVDPAQEAQAEQDAEPEGMRRRRPAGVERQEVVDGEGGQHHRQAGLESIRPVLGDCEVEQPESGAQHGQPGMAGQAPQDRVDGPAGGDVGQRQQGRRDIDGHRQVVLEDPEHRHQKPYVEGLVAVGGNHAVEGLAQPQRDVLGDLQAVAEVFEQPVVRQPRHIAVQEQGAPGEAEDEQHGHRVPGL